MKRFIFLLISLALFTSSVHGQKILCSTADSVYLIDISTKQKYNLLPNEKSYRWSDGKFMLKEGNGIFYRYKTDYKTHTLLVKEYYFDTLTYKTTDLKEYSDLEERWKNYWYHYQGKDSSRYLCYNNIYLKTDTGFVKFIPEEDLGKTQIRFKRGFEKSDGKLICERWHVKHHSDKLSVEPVQIIEIDISTKQMTPLINGWHPSLSKDERYILYTCYGECTERYGIYDLQNREVVFMFDGIYARWVQ